MTLEKEEILTIVTVQRLTKTTHITIYEKGLQSKRKPFSFELIKVYSSSIYSVLISLSASQDSIFVISPEYA
jgi:hypothetical protein